MARLDVRALTQPCGIMRAVASVLSWLSLGLAAYGGPEASSYWPWCVFTWTFCGAGALVILVLELTRVREEVPFAWDDSTAAFAVMAALMTLSTSIIYPTFFASCPGCDAQIGASVVSWLCFVLFVGLVAWSRYRPSAGQSSGFLSTPPGLMKMLEAFVACLVFTSLEAGQYSGVPELQWCVAVYALCFILAVVVVALCIWRPPLPFSFDRMAIAYNVLAAAMYLSAMMMWPLYAFRDRKSRPHNCGRHCSWDKLVVVSAMTVLNFIVYTLDSIYSVRTVFCNRNQ